MEAVAALGVAAAAAQFIEFGLKILKEARKIFNNATDAAQDEKSLDTRRLSEQINQQAKTLRAAKLGAGTDFDPFLSYLVEECISVSDRLRNLLDTFEGQNGTKLGWKLAYVRVKIKPEIQRLGERMTCLSNELSKHRDREQLDSIQASNTEILTVVSQIQATMKKSARPPPELGYPWEAGELTDHIKIDDGIGNSYYLPLMLCSSPQHLRNTLKLRFSDRDGTKLPGFAEVEKSNFELLAWHDEKPIQTATEDWNKIFSPGSKFKISFLKTVLTPRLGAGKKCPRCQKPYPTSMLHQRGKWEFDACKSCGLSIRRVDPMQPVCEDDSDLEFFDANRYWEHKRHRTRTPPNNVPLGPIPSRKTKAGQNASSTKASRDPDMPSLEVICRRVSISWAPTYNFSFRYALCRCVIFQSSPSRISISFPPTLVFRDCPRHNSKGIRFPDYGKYHNIKDDPYFEPWGGYDVFRGVVCTWLGAMSRQRQNISLGDKFATAEELPRIWEATDAIGDDKFLALLKKYNQELVAGRGCRNTVKSPFKSTAFEFNDEQISQAGDSMRRLVEEFEKETCKVLDGKWDGVPWWENKLEKPSVL